MTRWLSSFFRRTSSSSSRGTKPNRRTVSLEVLEDRTAPAVLTVNTLADGPINHADSLLTLREAIAVVNASDTTGLSAGELGQITGTLGTDDVIRFTGSLGTPASPGILSLTEDQLTLSADVSIEGLGLGRLAITRSGSAATAFRIFHVEMGVTASITNLAISGGAPDVDLSGGGILNDGTITVRFVLFSGNVASGVGGGGAIENSGTLTASYCSFENNSASFGGALDLDNVNAVATVSNSTFSGNSALSGGAVYLDGVATFINCTFSGNSSDTNGGGIRNNGELTLVNTTVTGNRADADDDTDGTAGGIKTSDPADNPDAVTVLYNTIVVGNLRGSASPVASDLDSSVNVSVSSVNNLIGDSGSAGGLTHGTNGNIVGNSGTGTLAVDTVLNVTLADNGGGTRTHALVQNSPALGGGSESVPGFVRYDQRDAARDGNDPDMGAYDVQHPLSPVGVPPSANDTFAPKPSANTNVAFIKGLYQSTLLRSADDAEVAIWINALNAGFTLQQVAFGFVNSDENRGNQVDFYYRYFLGRIPEASEIAIWVSVLKSGRDEGDVMADFALSDEFSGQNNNVSFVNLMYYALLSRAAEPSGFNDWLNALNSNSLTRRQVVNAFLRTDESLGRVVSANFQSYLKRPVDAQNLNAFVAAIKNGTTFGQASATILASGEFFTLADANR